MYRSRSSILDFLRHLALQHNTTKPLKLMTELDNCQSNKLGQRSGHASGRQCVAQKWLLVAMVNVHNSSFRFVQLACTIRRFLFFRRNDRCTIDTRRRSRLVLASAAYRRHRKYQMSEDGEGLKITIGGVGALSVVKGHAVWLLSLYRALFPCAAAAPAVTPRSAQHSRLWWCRGCSLAGTNLSTTWQPKIGNYCCSRACSCRHVTVTAGGKIYSTHVVLAGCQYIPPLFLHVLHLFCALYNFVRCFFCCLCDNKRKQFLPSYRAQHKFS